MNLISFSAYWLYGILALPWLLYWCRAFWSKSPNGPWSLPFFGNVWTFHRLMSEPVRTCKELKRRYGEVVHLHIGTWPLLIINSPQCAYELLQKHAVNTSSRPFHNSLRVDTLPNRVVLLSDGPEFRALRKLYHSLLQDIPPQHLVESQEEESLAFLQAVLRRPESFRFECERFAMNIILRLMYRSRLGECDDKVVKDMFGIWESMYLYFLPGSLSIDFIPGLAKLPKFLQPWRSIIDNLVGKLKNREAALHATELQKLQDSIHAGTSFSCLGASLLANEIPGAVGRDDTIEILAMLLGAGSDTTSAVLQVFFKVIALHPAEAMKAQCELDLVVGKARLPCCEDTDRLPYVRALLKELHRWAPIAVVGIPHAAACDMMYAGKSISKGTILVPNLPALSRSEEIYNDPDLFKPERFIGHDCDSMASARSADYKQRDHFHFGFGRRFCPGTKIADSSLFIFIARVLYAFDIRPVDECPLYMDEQRRGLLRKPLPFRVSLSPRTAAHAQLIHASVAAQAAAGRT